MRTARRVNNGKFWQLDRNDEKHAKDDAAKAAYAAPAPELTPDEQPTPGTRVQASGTYDPTADTLLRNRVRDGEGGYDVLTPLVIGDSTAVLVDRGWVARNVVDNERADLAPPSGMERRVSTLRRAGTEVDMHTYKDLGHGF